MDAVFDLIVTVLFFIIIEIQRRQIKELDERVSELEDKSSQDKRTHIDTQ